MNPLTPQQIKFFDAVHAIRMNTDKMEAAFMARQLVQATLPHKNPGDVPLWTRRNGNLILTVRPGQEKGKLLGYPYGTIPRLLLFWITTEALQTKSRRLELGSSLTAFMREIGLNPDNGGAGAKRSDARRLREQMKRLFRATISFDQERGNADGWLDMQVAPEGVLWWDEKQPDQSTLWTSWIQLSEKFYEAITAAPVPVRMDALRALKRSPLALDLYAWAAYTAFQTQRTGQARSVSWKWLHEQFGAEYSTDKNFSQKARRTLLKVQAVYSDLGLEFRKGGVKVLPCKPAITVKRKAAG